MLYTVLWLYYPVTYSQGQVANDRVSQQPEGDPGQHIRVAGQVSGSAAAEAVSAGA